MSTSILTSPRRLAALLLALFALTGCFTTSALIDPLDVPLNGTYTLDQIDSALEKAALERKWVLTRNAEGFLGTLDVRDHHLEVQFTRTKSLLSAHYKNSTNMEYDGKNIHKKYHMWMDQLFNSFRKKLAQ